MRAPPVDAFGVIALLSRSNRSPGQDRDAVRALSLWQLHMEIGMTGERWVTFDCFGTLIDWLTGFRAILAPAAGDRTDALISVYHEFERALEVETPHLLYRDVLTTGVSRAAAKLGLDLAADKADLLARHWDEQPLFADSLAGLDQLRGAGWKIGVLTNCDDDLFAKTLARHPKLTPDMVVTAQQVGSYKPALGHFRRFEQQSGVARGNWVHAAVSWFHDIEPAHRLGIARIWVDRDRTGHDPAIASAVVPNMAALPAAVAAVMN
jgi:2-haloacid dehalogenase